MAAIRGKMAAMQSYDSVEKYIEALISADQYSVSEELEYAARTDGFSGHWRVSVKRLNRYQIFYMPQNEDVLIVRVLHEARDVNKILGIQKP